VTPATALSPWHNSRCTANSHAVSNVPKHSKHRSGATRSGVDVESIDAPPRLRRDLVDAETTGSQRRAGISVAPRSHAPSCFHRRNHSVPNPPSEQARHRAGSPIRRISGKWHPCHSLAQGIVPALAAASSRSRRGRRSAALRACSLAAARPAASGVHALSPAA
jgi:hypothetical protein